jgi:Fe-Mn family superoxide dismutase
MTTTRRELLQTVSAGIAVSALVGCATAQSGPALELPPLPYPVDALEPHIDAQTMTIHHDKHHQAYVTNLVNALRDHTELSKKPLAEILGNLDAVPESIRTAVRNNGGGHSNHSLFWRVMSPKGGGTPKGELLKAIEGKFGSFDKFKEDFSKAGATQFGSGWAWLSVDGGKQLVLSATANQDTPLMTGLVPILGVDVWEHAYYLKYQNRRADYLAAWWNVVNWDTVSEEYARALKA